MTANSPFPIITVSGEPFERGFQYGSQCRNIISLSLKTFAKAYKDDMKLEWNQMLDIVRKFSPFIENYDPEGVEEMRGIAEGAGKDIVDIMALHLKTELKVATSVGSFGGCTTVAALPEVTSTGNTLVGKNWDWTAEMKKLGVIIRKKPNKGPSSITLCEAGLMGRDGFNSAGISIVCNALNSNKWRPGVPLHIITNKAMRAETLNDAMEAVLKAERASSNNYLIAHMDGEALNLETAPHTYNVIWAKDGLLAHTNHFLVQNPEIKDYMPEEFPNTLTRFYRASKMLYQNRSKISLETIKAILTDHFDKPYSICLHPVPDGHGAFIQTNASIIVDLTMLKMFVANGPPCQNEYMAIDSSEIIP